MVEGLMTQLVKEVD